MVSRGRGVVARDRSRALIGVVILLLTPWCVAAQANGNLQIFQFNIGQGDAELIVSPLGETVLIDSGPVSASSCASATGIVTQLANLGVTRLDYNIASHYDADHVGCTDQVLAHWPVQIAAYDRGTASPPTTQTYARYVTAVGAKRQTVTVGQTITLDMSSVNPVRLQVVAVNANGGAGSLTENDRSVVLVLHYGSFDAEFGGDLSGDTSSTVHNIESRIASAVGQVELYKVHHHGSATSSNAAYMNAIHPKVATLSMSATNSFGHPTATALGNIHGVGAIVYWTTQGKGATAGSMDVVANGTILTQVPVGGGNFTVTAAGVTTTYASWGTAQCSYTLSPTSATVGYMNGNGAVNVSTDSACSWSAASNAAFVTVTGGASGTGPGTVNYSVAATAVPRSGTMTIAGLTFTVTETAPPFTDDPLQSGVTVIRAVHISELRTRIDALRQRYGLPAFAWTDASLSGVFVKAVHITELRSGLADIYAAAGRVQPTYTDPSLIAGVTTGKVTHIAELRAAVVAIE